MFSIICIYNNLDMLKTWLIPELSGQKAEYEKIFINNLNNEFPSAADALNNAVISAHGNYLMFIHQDVKLEDVNWLERAEYYMKNLKNAGVVGVAGISEIGNTRSERGRNIIKWGDPPKVWDWSNPIERPMEVQTLDECLFIVPRKVFAKLNFDSYTCNNWHLYAVDLCLAAKKLGFTNYVLPLSIWHRGTSFRINGVIPTLFNGGHLPKEYYKTLKRILFKYKKDFNWIYTTCGEWNTKQLLITQRAMFLIREVINKISNLRNKKDFEDLKLDVLR